MFLDYIDSEVRLSYKVSSADGFDEFLFGRTEFRFVIELVQL